MVGWTRWTESHGRLKLGHLSDPQHVRVCVRHPAQFRSASDPTALGERLGHALDARGRKRWKYVANDELPEKRRRQVECA
jgi:hypothetical protein